MTSHILGESVMSISRRMSHDLSNREAPDRERIIKRRAKKAYAIGALRDGFYLLPDRVTQRQQLGELVNETIGEGGSAWLLTRHAQSSCEPEAYRALFDRAAKYAEFKAALSAVRKALARLTPQELTRALRKLRRGY